MSKIVDQDFIKIKDQNVLFIAASPEAGNASRYYMILR